jgi:hypothetical protein
VTGTSVDGVDERRIIDMDFVGADSDNGALGWLVLIEGCERRANHTVLLVHGLDLPDVLSTADSGMIECV